MNRFLAHASVIALCAACSLTPLSVARADDAQPSDAQPAANSDSMPSTLEGQIQRAKDLRAKGDLAEAGHSLAQILLVAPDDIRVVGEYGKVLVQQGRSKDAVAFLNHAVQLKGSDWTLYSALGVAYDQLDDHADARKAYDHALALKPGEPSVINNYAVSRMLSGDYAGGEQMLAQLQSGGANDPKIAGNLAKAQELKPVPAPVATAAAQQPVAKAPGVVASAKIDPATTIMQKVPVDPQAGPVGKSQIPAANSAPAKTASVAPAAQPTVATGAPRALPNTKMPVAVAAVAPKIDPATTIMQKVPVDPQAGPVTKPAAVASKAPAKTAPKAVAPKAVAKTTTPPPTLRTASD